MTAPPAGPGGKNIEERVARLETRIDQLERIEKAVVGLRSDFNDFRNEFSTYRTENGAVLARILATLESLQHRPLVFRWPWESRA
jgi:hypothetical protein